MTVLITLGIFVVATVALVKAADYFIEAIEYIGAALKLPHFFTGVLFVAIGTSLPELLTGISAVLRDEGDLLAGNVFGSDIANVLLGLGAVVWISKKDLRFKQDIFAVHFPVLLTALFMSVGMLMDGVVTRIEGGFLVGLMGVYLWYLHSQKDAEEMDFVPAPWKWKPVWVAVGSLLVVLIASDQLVVQVLALAAALGASSTALSATLVAVGTSLPEMMVVYAAIKKNNPEMAVGNILGSNIFNIVLILGVGALIAPIVVGELTRTIILPATVMSLLLYWAVSKNQEVTRHEGLALTLAYVFFLGKLYGWL